MTVSSIGVAVAEYPTIADRETAVTRDSTDGRGEPASGGDTVVTIPG